MSTYLMQCDNPECNLTEEVERSIVLGPPSTCAKCGESVHQIYGDPIISVRGDLKEFGHVAEHNSKKMGKELTAKKTEEWKPKPYIPWYRQATSKESEMTKPLDVSKIRDVDRYIREGVK